MTTNVFKISNTVLGKRLSDIRNNVIETFTPIPRTVSQTLTPNEFVDAIINGAILADTTATPGNVEITMPDARDVLSILQCKKYDSFRIEITNIGATPYTNELVIIPSSSIVITHNLPSVVFHGNSSRHIYCICYDDNPLTAKFILF